MLLLRSGRSRILSSDTLDAADCGFAVAISLSFPRIYPDALSGQASILFQRASRENIVTTDIDSNSYLERALEGFKNAVRHGYTGLVSVEVY